ncbi:MAG: DUF4416 family protein [Nitrospirae bacterium]|nr:DUF4416 family protein [Nitrospirota bacterium]
MARDHPAPPEPLARPFISVFAASDPPIHTALERAEAALGPALFVSQLVPFGPTRYYEEEFGPRIVRRFALFEGWIPETDLVRIKAALMQIEDGTREANRRRVNLDAGLLTLSRLILASHKPAPHRLLLSSGVWAELTLVYESGEYRPLRWTYPDYASQTVRDLLRALRSEHLSHRHSTR